MAVEKTNSSSSLAEVIDRILDKGIVIDAWVRVSLVGIESRWSDSICSGSCLRIDPRFSHRLS